MIPLLQAVRFPVFRRHNVRIVLAEIDRQASGKVNFIDKGQAYIPITESVANVNYILNEVKKEWQMNLVIVTNDGVPLQDDSRYPYLII